MTTAGIPDKIYNTFRLDLAPSLPAWETLGPELRRAFIHIYHRGVKDGQDQVVEAITKQNKLSKKP
jgi:hypothetical protein